MTIGDFAAVLWRERELLEILTFKLEEEQLLLVTRKSRWLQFATREIEQVLDPLRVVGLERSVKALSLAEEWNGSANPTLRNLVENAPPGPWGEILEAHLDAMTRAVAQISELRDANKHLLQSGADLTALEVNPLAPAADSIPPSTSDEVADRALLDRKIMESTYYVAVDVLTRVPPAALLEFLG